MLALGYQEGLVLLAQDGFFSGVEQGLSDAWERIIEFTPKLIGALIILFVGWLIARLLRTVFDRVFTRLGFDKLLQRAGLTETMNEAGYTASGLLAAVVYWLVLLIALLLAAEALAIDTLTNLLRDLIAYIPLVIVAAVVLLVAAALASFLSDLVRPWAERENIAWLAPVVRWSVIIFGLVAAFNTLNLAEELVNTLLIALVGTIGITLAIAFGVGGIKAAEKWWNKTMPDRMTKGDSGPTQM